MDLPYLFRNRCESIATQVRYELKLMAFDPLPAARLADHLHVRLFQPNEMDGASPEAIEYLTNSENWSAILMVSFGRPEILYNPNRSLARTESDIMHELAHWLLKHPLQSIRWHNNIPYRDFDSRIEAEATYLGGALLVPKRAILWSLQRNMSLEDIASSYGCSQPMAQWRINSSV